MPHRIRVPHQRSAQLDDRRFTAESPYPSHRFNERIRFGNGFLLFLHVHWSKVPGRVCFQRPLNQERRRDLTRAGGLVNVINECNAPENRTETILGKPKIVLVFAPPCQRFKPFATGIPPCR